MKKENALDILAILMDTPLSEVIQCIQSGEFDPSPDDLVGKDETVIGELTTFEKATMTVRNRRGKQAHKIAVNNNNMVELCKRQGRPADKKMVEENITSYKTNCMMGDFFDKLLWSSIRNRLGASAFKDFGVAVRAEYKITTFPPRKEDKRDMVSKMFMGDDPMEMFTMLAAMRNRN